MTLCATLKRCVFVANLLMGSQVSRWSRKSQVSFAKEPYERDYILQKRPIIVRSLLMGVVKFHVGGYIVCS